MLQNLWADTYGPDATGDFADKCYWVCTENWSNQNYPISLPLYSQTGPWGNGYVPLFGVIGPDYIVAYNGNNMASAISAINNLIIPSIIDPMTTPLTDDFESGSLSSEWYQFGTIDWTAVEPGNESTYSAFSGDLNDGESASMVVGTDFGGDNVMVAFDLKVSSEASYDFLFLYADGVPIGSWSGNVDWTSVEFQLDPGVHTLNFAYEKDGSVSTGDDAAWIDNVFITHDMSINDDLSIINGASLKQNYPNPFNPTTKINFELAVANYGSAEIVVYNGAGQEVWNKAITAESSSIDFDASNLNSGVYYYSLVIDGKKMDTKSMILMK